jgi:hypothetical protein
MTTVSNKAELVDWKEALDKNAKAVAGTFVTTDGKKTLALLRKHFASSVVFNENPIIMAKNAGQHELVQYLEALLERGSDQ